MAGIIQTKDISLGNDLLSNEIGRGVRTFVAPDNGTVRGMGTYPELSAIPCGELWISSACRFS
jgi:hypothetical protein